MKKINIEFIEDKIFEEGIVDKRFKKSGAFCRTIAHWPNSYSVIKVRLSLKNNLYKLIPLLIHEYIHAINEILFGWNLKLVEVMDYINEVIWTPIRTVLSCLLMIIRDDRDYFNKYWNAKNNIK